jgi:hypothetical protein
VSSIWANGTSTRMVLPSRARLISHRCARLPDQAALSVRNLYFVSSAALRNAFTCARGYLPRMKRRGLRSSRSCSLRGIDHKIGVGMAEESTRLTTVSRSKGGVDYLMAVLKRGPRRISRALLWKIPHQSGKEDISLKVGRYQADPSGRESPEVEGPKSELTLDDAEFKNLVQFLAENYEPFRQGIKQYIPIETSDERLIVAVRRFLKDKDAQSVVELIHEHNLLPEELMIALNLRARLAAIVELESMIGSGLLEHSWQNWFKANDWVLGTDFVEVLDDRVIDTRNIADYLVRAYDGFLDVIEIKRPDPKLPFWAARLDHGNYVPSGELVAAITQASKYLYDIELEANSVKFLDRVGVRAVKPRCVLIFGRSHDWNQEQHTAFRILNSNYHSLAILTYDHVLARAKKIAGVQSSASQLSSHIDPDDIPF